MHGGLLCAELIYPLCSVPCWTVFVGQRDFVFAVSTWHIQCWRQLVLLGMCSRTVHPVHDTVVPSMYSWLFQPSCQLHGMPDMHIGFFQRLVRSLGVQ